MELIDKVKSLEEKALKRSEMRFKAEKERKRMVKSRLRKSFPIFVLAIKITHNIFGDFPTVEIEFFDTKENYKF